MDRMYVSPNFNGQKLELGKILVERFIGQDALDYPPGQSPYQDQAEKWLYALGFERVEWFINEDGDILLCFLWFTQEGKMHEFGLEFSGHDAQIISVLEITKSVQL